MLLHVVTCCYMLLLLIVDFPGGYTIPIMPLQAPPMISIISKTSRVLATGTRSPGKDSWKFPQKTHAGTASTPRHDTNDLSSPRFLLNVHLYKLVSSVSHVQLGCVMVLNHLPVDFLRGKISVVRRRNSQ